MEAVFSHVDWQDSLNTVGVYEQFETFFDVFPYEGEPCPNGAIVKEEREAIATVLSLVRQASHPQRIPIVLKRSVLFYYLSQQAVEHGEVRSAAD